MNILVSTNPENENKFFVTYNEIESIPFAGCYNNDGIEIGSTDAGDSVCILSQKAVDLLAENDHDYNVGDNIYANDDWDAFDVVASNSSLTECEDYELNQEYVKGFNFWTGNNWNAIIIESDNHESEYELVIDEDIIQKIKILLEEKELTAEGAGFKYYESEQFKIEESAWQGKTSWVAYTITEKE